jgi:hypothetical protein
MVFVSLRSVNVDGSDADDGVANFQDNECPPRLGVTFDD